MASENPNKVADHAKGQAAAQSKTTPATANPYKPETDMAADWIRGYVSQCFTRQP